MTFRKTALVAAILAAPLALSACSDSDDAAYETETDTVEIEANEALEGVDAMPVADPQANIPDPVAPPAPTVDEEAAEVARQQTLQDEGDDAAATAAAAADAMIEE